MKKLITLFLALVLLILCCATAFGDETAFDARQRLLFDTVKYCADLPKDAQVINAAEYYCKVEGYSMRLLLLNCTQNEYITNLFGNGAGVVIFDTDTEESVTFANFTYPEGNIDSRTKALHMLYNCLTSGIENGSEIIYADHEMIFPFEQAELDTVNAALLQHFTR